MEALYPFATYGEVLHFYVAHNPARQKFQNLAEPHGGHYEFYSVSAEQIFSLIGGAIETVLRCESKTNREIWYRRHAPVSETGIRDKAARKEAQRKAHENRSAVAIARDYGMGKRRVNKILQKIRELIEEEFRARELIPPLPPKRS